MQGNKVMMIIIIALLIILLGMVAFVAYYGYNVLRNNDAVTDSIGSGGATVHETVKKLSQKEIDLITLSSPVKANLRTSESGKEHAVSLIVSIGINNTVKKESEETVTLVTEREPVVRDTVIGILRGKTLEDLKETSDTQGMEKLKEEILEALRIEFATNLIVSITISEILYQ